MKTKNGLDIKVNTEPSIKIANRLDEGAETRPEETVMADSALIEYSWLAGILDSEGTVWMRKNGRGEGFQPAIEICNTCPILIKKVWDIMESHRPCMFIKKPSGLGTKNVYRVYSRGEYAVNILAKILPYMTTKKLFANAIVNFYSKRKLWSKWTEEEVNEALQIKRNFMISRSI